MAGNYTPPPPRGGRPPPGSDAGNTSRTHQAGERAEETKEQKRPGFGEGIGAGFRHGWRAGGEFKEGLAQEERERERQQQPPKAPAPPVEVHHPVTGIGRRQPKTTIPTVWNPDPASVLFFGLALVAVNFVVRAQSSDLFSFLWNVQTADKAGTTSAGGRVKTLIGEVVFVFVLFVLSTLSPAIARIATVFILALWAVFLLFYGPKLVSLIPH